MILIRQATFMMEDPPLASVCFLAKISFSGVQTPKKQRVVVLSSIEVEYTTLTHVATELVKVKTLFTKLGLNLFALQSFGVLIRMSMH